MDEQINLTTQPESPNSPWSAFSNSVHPSNSCKTEYTGACTFFLRIGSSDSQRSPSGRPLQSMEGPQSLKELHKTHRMTLARQAPLRSLGVKAQATCLHLDSCISIANRETRETGPNSSKLKMSFTAQDLRI